MVAVAHPAHAVFDEVYRREYAALVRLAWALTGRQREAEELVQEAFLRAYRCWSTVGAYERPGAWLRRVVLNLASSRLRRARAEANALMRLGQDRAPVATLHEDTLAFWAAVRRLPARQAQVVVLRYVEDRSTPEIAEVLAIAEGTVRATLHQARQELRVTLGPDDDEDGRP